jgi:hypothetical protein
LKKRSVQLNLCETWNKEAIQKIKDEVLEAERKKERKKAEEEEEARRRMQWEKEYDFYMKRILEVLTTECRAARSLWREIESGGKLARRVLSHAIRIHLISFKYLYSGKKRTRFYYLVFYNDLLTWSRSQFYYPEIQKAIIDLRKASDTYYNREPEEIKIEKQGTTRNQS